MAKKKEKKADKKKSGKPAKKKEVKLEKKVSKPEKKKDKRDDEIVRLARAFNTVQAHVWEQALTDAGIRCKVVGDYLDAGLGDMPGFRSEIWVHKDDVERAKKIIEQHPHDAIARKDDVEEEEDEA